MRANKFFWGTFILATLFLLGTLFLRALGPRERKELTHIKSFEVEKGDGFLEISRRLEEEGVIKSSSAFNILLLFSGTATRLKPGSYELDAAKSSFEILRELVSGSRREIVIRIPEGASAYEIDIILAKAGVARPGEFLEYVTKGDLEGHLFPDTYEFLTNSSSGSIAEKLLENFNFKTEELFAGKNNKEINEALILASLLEKEVPDSEERKIVAGILKKRIAIGIPLQVDATICYIKKVEAYPEEMKCYPYAQLDFKRESDYNTYLHRGLPPRPIGNPGFSAIEAAISPAKSTYLYYLSDPKTGRTIFSRTLEEHNESRAKYLGL